MHSCFVEIHKSNSQLEQYYIEKRKKLERKPTATISQFRMKLHKERGGRVKHTKKNGEANYKFVPNQSYGLCIIQNVLISAGYGLFLPGFMLISNF